MANTFKALCEEADWSKDSEKKLEKESGESHKREVRVDEPQQGSNMSENGLGLNLRYDIHVHLPETTNMDVYDAIFHSLKNTCYSEE
jgi:hypothetical protein